jgi:hypothetical protein
MPPDVEQDHVFGLKGREQISVSGLQAVPGPQSASEAHGRVHTELRHSLVEPN